MALNDLSASQIKSWFQSNGGIEKKEAHDLLAAARSAPGASDTERLAGLLTEQGQMSPDAAREAARRIVDELTHHAEAFRTVSFSATELDFIVPPASSPAEPGRLVTVPVSLSDTPLTLDPIDWKVLALPDLPTSPAAELTPPPGGFVSSPHGILPVSDHRTETEDAVTFDATETGTRVGYRRESQDKSGERQFLDVGFRFETGNRLKIDAGGGREYLTLRDSGIYTGVGWRGKGSVSQNGDLWTGGLGAGASFLAGFRNDRRAIDVRLDADVNVSLTINPSQLSDSVSSASDLIDAAGDQLTAVKDSFGPLRQSLSQLSREAPAVSAALDQVLSDLDAVASAATPVAAIVALGALDPSLATLRQALDTAGDSYKAAKDQIGKFMSTIDQAVDSLSTAASDLTMPKVGFGGGYSAGVTVAYTETIHQDNRFRAFTIAALAGGFSQQFGSDDRGVNDLGMQWHMSGTVGLGIEVPASDYDTLGMRTTVTAGARGSAEKIGEDLQPEFSGTTDFFWRTSR